MMDTSCSTARRHARGVPSVRGRLAWALGMAVVAACGDGHELGAGSGQEGPVACAATSDCPAATRPCEVAVCVGGLCGATAAPAGTFVPEEVGVEGDCKRLICGDGGALVTEADPADVPIDAGSCATARCSGPNPVLEPANEGGVCALDGDTSGLCVEGACEACEPGTPGCEAEEPCTPGEPGCPEAPDGPCIRVSPRALAFGGRAVGQQAVLNVTVSACGTSPLTLSEASVTSDRAGVFVLSPAGPTLPLTLEPGATVAIPVIFTAPAGATAPSTGTLRLVSDAPEATTDVALSGHGLDASCPTAVITVAEGDEVVPQTNLHLSARNSSSSAGDITRWQWSVVQPSGSVAIFAPAPNAQDVTFEANLVGSYVFRLKVWDALGVESCEEAETTVVVTSDEGIRVELTWNTPHDADQSDTGVDAFGGSKGTDMDLHFLHPLAAGKWFDQAKDCFWLNTQPNWGGADSSDDPSLDRDDFDGAGPENLNLSVPEFGATYRVGVDYWDDWGFGMSEATIRIYIYGQRRFHWERVPMNMHDLWDVATIRWPDQLVTGVTTPSNGPVIQAKFPRPSLF